MALRALSCLWCEVSRLAYPAEEGLGFEFALGQLSLVVALGGAGLRRGGAGRPLKKGSWRWLGAGIVRKRNIGSYAQPVV